MSVIEPVHCVHCDPMPVLVFVVLPRSSYVIRNVAWTSHLHAQVSARHTVCVFVLPCFAACFHVRVPVFVPIHVPTPASLLLVFKHVLWCCFQVAH
jgi:hypothetical protein